MRVKTAPNIAPARAPSSQYAFRSQALKVQLRLVKTARSTVNRGQAAQIIYSTRPYADQATTPQAAPMEMDLSTYSRSGTEYSIGREEIFQVYREGVYLLGFSPLKTFGMAFV